MSDKKELVSERDLYEWYNETESMFGFWMSYVAKKINQRHEERMKERVIEFAFFSRNHLIPDRFAMEKWYNEKYGSDE